MKKKIFIVLFLVALGAAYYGYRQYNKPFANLKEAKADFVLEPSTWMAEFEQDEVAALNKYLNKVIELEGAITEVQMIENRLIWSIATGNELSTIQCEMDGRFIEKIKDKYKMGDNVKVQEFVQEN
ncbi:MAG: hypothetical protein IPL42_15275 [Saprospiraceae bacterium]|nr:hypothetical protein [Saprospiraceae bacterium]